MPAEFPAYSTNRLQLIDWRPLGQGTLRGFAAIRISPPGLLIYGLTVHCKGGIVWVGLPGRPMIDPAGKVLMDDQGKRRYSPVVEIPDCDVRERLTNAVTALIRQRDPEALQ